jgi:hypothetical protein
MDGFGTEPVTPNIVIETAEQYSEAAVSLANIV